ncbi:hypothetical protein ASD83_16030 [Devosia sp. Root685]|uniref:hypothetical protein n=1 Tax=Devosia sp. Root685 TaxID=1736587 RepID=UPI0006FDDEDD|nr:hypothetical protein [Devosia sp. Root685]KRA96603.1 hypothetical protein ASD83_16030 [Devosia sp. Root685]
MKAYAYVVGPQDKAWQTLFDMAGALGFAGVSDFRGLNQVEQQAGETPVCYFLFSAAVDLSALRPVADAIRFSASRAIRFSPMVYCAEDPSVETTMACINMGFDDIVALPQSQPKLRQRLARQIGHSLVFYETAGYFGPDRRNRVAALEPNPSMTRVGGPFRRLEIVRNLLDGVSVLRDEFTDVAAMQTLQ